MDFTKLFDPFSWMLDASIGSNLFSIFQKSDGVIFSTYKAGNMVYYYSKNAMTLTLIGLLALS